MATNFTDDNIRAYVKDVYKLDDKFSVNDDATAGRIYDDAKKYGIGADQLDRALGWSAGTTSGWTTRTGKGALVAAAPPPPTTTGGSSGGSNSDRPNGGGGYPGALANPPPAPPPPPPPAAPPPPAYVAPPPPAWTSDPVAANAAMRTAAGPMRDAPAFKLSDGALVSNQLAKLLASDSPYITRARAKAAEYSNSRGLLNSTMGAEAGEAAAIDAGGQIAAGDANAVLQGDLAQYGATSDFARDDNNFGREGALMAMQAGYDTAARREGFSFESGEAAADRGFKTSERLGSQAFTSSENLLDRTNRLDLQNLQEAGADRRQGAQFDFQRGEGALDRAFSRSEREAGQTFTSGENRANREFQSGENAADRTFRTGERVAGQEFAAGQNAADREFRTGERQAGQTFEAGERQADRDAREASDLRNRDTELFRTYMDARYRLETDPNLDQAGKDRAIDEMSNWFYNEALPAFAAGFTTPGAWPRMPRTPSAPAANDAGTGLTATNDLRDGTIAGGGGGP